MLGYEAPVPVAIREMMECIGVARIFSGGALFVAQKDDDLLVVALKTQAKTIKLTTTTVQICPIS